MLVNNISFPLSLSFSRRCDRLLPLLGSVPRPAPRLRLLHREDNSIAFMADQYKMLLCFFSGHRVLSSDKRVPDVRVRHPVLRLLHHQPHPLQPHVP